MSSTWTFNNVDLSSFGNITVLDDPYDLIPRRGKNKMVPFRHGTIFTQKFYDERSIQFGIAIYVASASALETSMDSLHALLSSSTPKVLQNTREDSSVRTALAVVEKPIQFKRSGDRFARVVIEFLLHEPFFRSDTLIADNTLTIDASPKTETIDNTGTVEETNPIVTLTGPLDNVVITNTDNGCVLSYLSPISNGDVVVITAIDGELTAIENGTTNVIADVTHEGSYAFFVLDEGDNDLSITSDEANTGTVKISFYPPYI